MFKDYPDILTVPQVAKALGVGTTSAYQLVREKRIGFLRCGKKILIPKPCLEDFVLSAKNNVVLERPV